MQSFIDPSILMVFIPTVFLLSISPGMNMTLSMTMGMSIGVRRTTWLMYGELVGVGVTFLSAILGVAAIMLQYPNIFLFIKYAGGAYLFYLGMKMWICKIEIDLIDQKKDLNKFSRV